MPNCLFHHQYTKALNAAISKLKLKCQELDASPDQKAFNVDTQIPLMEQASKNIQAIELTEHFINWHAFRETLSKHIDTAKTTAANKQAEKQAKCGTNITTEQIDTFGNKLLAIYDEMRSEIEKDNFKKHGNRPECQYISNDYNKSPFLNQLINLALEYRFNKIQEKHVEAKTAYSAKHIGKWELLNEVIATWEEYYEKDISHIKTSIDGILLGLINKEQIIENEIGSSIFGFFKGTAIKVFKQSAQYIKPEEENRKLLNSQLTVLYNNFSSVNDQSATQYPNMDSYHRTVLDH